MNSDCWSHILASIKLLNTFLHFAGVMIRSPITKHCKCIKKGTLYWSVWTEGMIPLRKNSISVHIGTWPLLIYTHTLLLHVLWCCFCVLYLHHSCALFLMNKWSRVRESKCPDFTAPADSDQTHISSSAQGPSSGLSAHIQTVRLQRYLPKIHCNTDITYCD